MSDTKSPSKATNLAGAFLDKTEQAIVRMHSRISGGFLHLDELAFRDVSVAADGIMRTAKMFGWEDLSNCAAQIGALTRRPIGSIDPIMTRALDPGGVP